MSEDAPALQMTLADLGQNFLSWCRREPLAAALAASILGVLAYYFCFYHVFVNGAETTLRWMWESWNPENDLDHGAFIAPAALFIVWYHRAQLAAAPKRGSWLGLAVTVLGVIMFIAAVRTLQPRIAILALPVLAYGMVRFLWGPATARIVLFPCAFLLFMVPIGFLVSRTVGLQTMTAAFAAKIATLCGIPVQADGAALRAVDGSFMFEVAGGCSGIRSLTAMTMLAALYVHFTQRVFWKKAVIFGSSLFFALLGNLVRIASVVFMAKLLNPRIASGLYHDYSGFVFFPFAVGAMVGFASLLNRDWSTLLQPEHITPVNTGGPRGPRPKGPSSPKAKPRGPISYDY